MRLPDANTIGGTQPGAGNVIGGGVYLFSEASSNVFEGNMIGTNAAGTGRLAGWGGWRGTGDSCLDGVRHCHRRHAQFPRRLTVQHHWRIDGGGRNLIAGGVLLDTTAQFDVVEGNYIGTDVTGTTALLYPSQSSAGVMVAGGQYDFIGGDAARRGQPDRGLRLRSRH